MHVYTYEHNFFSLLEEMAWILNYNNVVSKMELYYIPFFGLPPLRKALNSLILSSDKLNCTNAVLLQRWLWH